MPGSKLEIQNGSTQKEAVPGTGTVTGAAVQSLLRLEPLVFVFFGKPFSSLTGHESIR